MKQGEIWYADLNPTEGSEQAGFRPVMIVSGNLANQYAPVVVCCPLTTKLKHYYGNPILKPNSINGLKKESEVMVIHIRSVSKTRLKKHVGSVSAEELKKCKETLNDLVTF
ncbi:MAG: type II toxin-antitoxin system PemK/MazF family toxin [Bacteroidota bacterium]|jgi:mRNA interferase MazF